VAAFLIHPSIRLRSLLMPLVVGGSSNGSSGSGVNICVVLFMLLDCFRIVRRRSGGSGGGTRRRRGSSSRCSGGSSSNGSHDVIDSMLVVVVVVVKEHYSGRRWE